MINLLIMEILVSVVIVIFTVAVGSSEERQEEIAVSWDVWSKTQR
jgi:hypothetical protein